MFKMKLWLLTQDQNRGYDTYDSAVVAAETEDDARKIWPGYGDLKWVGEIDDGYWADNKGKAGHYMVDCWAAHIHLITVAELGEANSELPAGVVLASFNAG